MSEINVIAVQVATPEHGSNSGISHDNDEDIEDLIATNLDAGPDYIDRTKEDKAENFSLALYKRTARNFISKYDYRAAHDILEPFSDIADLKVVRKKLKDIVDAFNRQDLPQGIKHKKISEDAKRVLNAYLTIEVQRERGNVAESLIRIKNLVEFILNDYIENRYPHAIHNLLVETNKDYPGLWGYSKILKANKEWELYESLKPFHDMNGVRNELAHSLEPLKDETMKILGPTMKSLKKLVMQEYHFSRDDFDFYHRLNEELVEKLK